MFPHVHMFRSTCLGFGLHAHMLDIMSMIISCLDLHVCMHVLCSYAYIRVFTWLYAWIHVLPCLCAKFLYVYMHVSMPICLCLCFHMLVCLDLCSLYVSCYSPCACALHAMLVCLGLGYVCHAMCYYSPFVALSSFFFFFIFFFFWCFGLLVWTRSRPYCLCHHPYTLAHIKGFGSSLFACLCSLVSMLFSCVSLSSSRLCHA